MEEIEIINGLDQGIPANVQEILDEIDEQIKEAHGDPEYLFDLARRYIGNVRARGMGLVKIIYATWKMYDKDKESFYEEAFIQLGLHKVTIDRYIAIWDMFENKIMPKNIEQDMKQRPLKNLVPIAKAIEQGYSIEQKDWEEIYSAPDESSIRKIIREIKGQEPRRNNLSLYIKKNGDILAYSPSETVYVGNLCNSPEEMSNPTIAKAVKRIIDGAGILEE